MTAGLVIGGVRFSAFGIRPVPKIDVLLLGKMGTEDAEGNVEPENLNEDDDEDDDENDHVDMVGVVMRDLSGNTRRVVLPRAMLPLLTGRLGVERGNEGDDESNENTHSNTGAMSPGGTLRLPESSIGLPRRSRD